jgi:hypothetical protein
MVSKVAEVSLGDRIKVAYVNELAAVVAPDTDAVRRAGVVVFPG